MKEEMCTANGEEENVWASLPKHRSHQQNCQLKNNATSVAKECNIFKERKLLKGTGSLVKQNKKTLSLALNT